MRIPVEWLGEYVDLKGASARDVAATLAQAGFEDEGIHGGDVTGPLVVGRVLSKVSEPQKSGKVIEWCQVDVGDANGTGEPQGIVCGAHNFDEGDLVVVILPGGELPGGFSISARKTYGHVSAGMICSSRELGLGDDHDGIIVLAEWLGPERASSLAPGQDLIPVLGLDRQVLEVDVTPDRGYAMSLRGIARDYAAVTGSAYRDPAPHSTASSGEGFPVELHDDAPVRGAHGCDRYVARIVRGVTAGAASPTWMQQRLTEAGMRPISLIVDVTNYVMLATGQPLHAFDLSTLDGPVVVRRARAGERMTTLDGTERVLHPEDLLITDRGERLLAIAGVMGAAAGEVSETTTDILLEAAHFDAVSVSRSARRHHLITEASRRFERGVDPLLAESAAELACLLLAELGGGVPDPVIRVVGSPLVPSPIRMASDLPARRLGISLTATQVAEALERIGAHIQVEDDVLVVTPPSWRGDLTEDVDLTEEIARVVGYDTIPGRVPQAPGSPGLPVGVRRRRLIATLLAARGLTEVQSQPFVSRDAADALGYPTDDLRRQQVEIKNPLSDELPLLRSSLLMSLSDVVTRNVARGRRDVAVFEVGAVAIADGQPAPAQLPPPGVHPDAQVLAAVRASVPSQPWHVAGMLAGNGEARGWWGSGRPVTAEDAVDLVHGIAEALGLRLTVVGADQAPFHPGRCVAVHGATGPVLGYAGELHPRVCQRLDLPARSVAFELDLDALLVEPVTRPDEVPPLSAFPVAFTDVALEMAADVPSAQVEAALAEGAGPLLESVRLFDVYTGSQVGAGRSSRAYRLAFRAPDRTLTTDEVNRLRDQAVSVAASRYEATLRGV